ncbi:hypothetical protein I3760_03G175300 [Carya illinoinensis]|nr:hypothetical protein I3760_03G175300 [Carya illinoinensis]
MTKSTQIQLISFKLHALNNLSISYYIRRAKVTLHFLLHLLPLANLGLALLLRGPLQLLPPGTRSAFQLNGNQFHLHIIWDIFVIKDMFHHVQPIDEALSL